MSYVDARIELIPKDKIFSSGVTGYLESCMHKTYRIYRNNNQVDLELINPLAKLHDIHCSKRVAGTTFINSTSIISSTLLPYLDGQLIWHTKF